MDLELLKAKKLYAQGNTAKEIASALNKSPGTIYCRGAKRKRH